MRYALMIAPFLVASAFAEDLATAVIAAPTAAAVTAPAPAPAPAAPPSPAVVPVVPPQRGMDVGFELPNPDSKKAPDSAAVPKPVPTGAAVTDYKKFRDPFQEIMVDNAREDKRSDLERYATSEFKLTGVISGPMRMRAILISPKGKSFIVNEGMKLGFRDGVIRKITTKSVIVTEKQVNELGENETAELELNLETDSVK